MTDLSARELRKLAPSLGLTGASRMTKDEILTWAKEHRTWLTVAQRTMLGLGFDRAARDALKPVPVRFYDPAVAGGDPDGRGALPRDRRRKYEVQVRRSNGSVGVVTKPIPKGRRPQGTAKPATRLVLVKARVAAGVPK